MLNPDCILREREGERGQAPERCEADGHAERLEGGLAGFFIFYFLERGVDWKGE